jgi:type VI secretion system secreted protein VgrG
MLDTIRLAELTGAVARAADAGIGFPPETSLRLCLVAVALGRATGLSNEDLRDVYHAALLRHAGCTASAHEETRIAGDEIQLRSTIARGDAGNPKDMLQRIVRGVGRGQRLGKRASAVATVLVKAPRVLPGALRGRCEVAIRFAVRLGLGPRVARALDEAFERWDGKGVGGPEGNENGCVRLKFHWDTETERLDKEPASCWVRVSQVFAGAGGGAVFHPRVGTEVIVEFEEGDPDRPIVTGRVYNGVQPAAANGKGAATVSTLKSLASPGGKVFNELQFNDTAGEEQVNLTAGKDWNSNVGNNRTETIQNDSKSSVLANRNEDTSADRTTTVGGNNSESVGGDESISVSGSQTISVGSSQSVSIGSSQTIGVGADRGLSVGGSQTTSVAASNSVAIGASETYTVGAAQDVAIGATKTENVGAVYALSVGGPMTETVGGPHTLTTPLDTTNATAHMVNSSVTTINAASTATINTATFEALASGSATIQGATIDISAGGDITISGGSVKIKAGSIELEGGSIKIAGGTTDVTGGVVKVN